MMTFNKKSTLNSILPTLILLVGSDATAKSHIEPSMVNIPSGSFYMGSSFGDDLAKPMHEVNLPAYQLGKYSVTMAEFRVFAKETGFKQDGVCDDGISENWLSGPENKGTATWDNHRYVINDFQPVSCITIDDTLAYIDWLNEKTGKQYRLPTEQEWEYATKANTTSRYFWGDDKDLTQVCKYANTADQASEYFASKQYGASYVGFLGHANCDDAEPYITLVGMYRPNPFGLYDMVGNTTQQLGSCYYPGYNVDATKDMNPKTCETLAHRGYDWHFPAQSHNDRGRFKKANGPSPGMGFRLAADGHQDKVAASTKAFETALSNAQSQRVATRPQLPKSPTNIQLNKLTGSTMELSWQASQDARVKGYDIYQSTSPYSHLLGGFYQKHYKKLQRVLNDKTSITLLSVKAGTSYRVVSVIDDLTSLPSKAVVKVNNTVTSIPGKLEMQHARALEGALLAHRKARKDKPEMYYLSTFFKGFEQQTITATFNVEVKKSAWYHLNYNGNSWQTGEYFKIWQNNHLAGVISHDAERDDTKSNHHSVYLHKGSHMLQVSITREGMDYLSLGWLDFSEIKSDG